MSHNETHSSRPSALPPSGRPVVRSLVALVALVLGLCANTLPASAVGPTVPDAPTISGITIGQNTVSVDFDANADGGAAITGLR